MARSICSTLASSSSSMRSASRVNGRLTRLTTKPGASELRIGVLPQVVTASVARVATSLAVFEPATTSTSFMTGAGLKKWRPSTRSGCAVAAEIASIESALVLVARRVSGDDDSSRRRKSVRLSSRSSIAASITRSASTASPSMDVISRILDRRSPSQAA